MAQFSSKFIIDSPPLLVVLAKIQFSPMLKIGDHIPDFQELVRTNGFPVYRQKDVKQLKFAGNSPPQEQNQRIWQFINSDNTEILSVGSDFLTLAVSNYSTFKQFSQSLRFSLHAISDVIEPSAFVALGFRTVNAIESPDESPDSIWEFLNPRLRGVDAKVLGSSHFHHEYQYWSETREGHLIIQCKYIHGKDAIPPDLRAEKLAMKRTLHDQPCVYTIQLDHSTSRKPKARPFETNEILLELEKLHETANQGFLACVTEKALDIWGFHPLP